MFWWFEALEFQLFVMVFGYVVLFVMDLLVDPYDKCDVCGRKIPFEEFDDLTIHEEIARDNPNRTCLSCRIEMGL